MNLREKILSATDIATEYVDIPEWDVTVAVRGTDGADRSHLLSVAIDPQTGDVNLESIYPDIIILCTFDPTTSERVFNDDDRAALLTKSSQALDRIAEVAMRLCGFTDDAVDKAGKGSSSTKKGATSTP